LVTIRHNWGEDRVYFHDRDGKLKALPTIWTSLRAEDPFLTVSKGRSHFRLEDLARLIEIVRKAEEEKQE
jgi:hypothetical protein